MKSRVQKIKNYRRQHYLRKRRDFWQVGLTCRGKIPTRKLPVFYRGMGLWQRRAAEIRQQKKWRELRRRSQRNLYARRYAAGLTARGTPRIYRRAHAALEQWKNFRATIVIQDGL